MVANGRKKIFANVATTAAAFDEGRYTQYTDKVRGRCLYAETVALARMALASIAQAEGDFATAIKHVQIAHRVYSKRASLMSRLAPVIKKDVGPLFLQGAKLVAEDDPFSTSARSKLSRPTSMTNHESGPGSTEEEAASRQNQIIASAEPILAFWTGKLLGEELFFAGHVSGLVDVWTGRVNGCLCDRIYSSHYSRSLPTLRSVGLRA